MYFVVVAIGHYYRKNLEHLEKNIAFVGFIVWQRQNISLGKELRVATSEIFPAGVWGLCLAFAVHWCSFVCSAGVQTSIQPPSSEVAVQLSQKKWACFQVPSVQCCVLTGIPSFSECIDGQIWKRANFKISGLENHFLGNPRHFLQLKNIDRLSYGRHIPDTGQNLSIYPTISAALNSLQGKVLFNTAPEKWYCLSKGII